MQMVDNLDLSIDSAKAQIWMDDVDAELAAVRALLRKVQAANSEDIAANDTIMEGIYKVGTAMGNAWDKMCNAFDDAQDKAKEAISKLGGAVQNVVNDVETIKNKFFQ